MYLHWDEKTITDFSEKAVAEMYNRGYVFTRIGKGVMHQTRSVRINLADFSLSSENRRILKKNEGLVLRNLPLPLSSYDWTIGKSAKDFYETKFGPNIMSAAKVKEMLTAPEKSNFNSLLTYSKDAKDIGYSISYESSKILHYSYPFYNLDAPKDTGLGMMILAVAYAREKGLKYIYLGSLQRPGDTYKLQFNGLEWFDGENWQKDLNKAKETLLLTQ